KELEVIFGRIAIQVKAEKLLDIHALGFGNAFARHDGKKLNDRLQQFFTHAVELSFKISNKNRSDIAGRRKPAVDNVNACCEPAAQKKKKTEVGGHPFRQPPTFTKIIVISADF